MKTILVNVKPNSVMSSSACLLRTACTSQEHSCTAAVKTDRHRKNFYSNVMFENNVIFR